MTTPVPTTAAHLAMVEALRDAKLAIDDLTSQACCGPGCVDDEAMDATKARLATVRAALEGWEKRPRLRDDEVLVQLMEVYTSFSDGEPETQAALLDAIEDHLFDTGPRTGGEGG